MEGKQDRGGRVKDTEGREGIKQEEREEENIKREKKGQERGGEGGRHKRAER